MKKKGLADRIGPTSAVEYYRGLIAMTIRRRQTTARGFAVGVLTRLLLFWACVMSAGGTANDSRQAAKSTFADEKISALLETMTVREKIGQMLAIVPEDLDPTLMRKRDDSEKRPASTEFTREMKETFRLYPAGTVVLFTGNIDTPEQTKKLIADLKEAARIPLMVSVDEEGGRIARVAQNVNFGIENLPPALETKSGEAACQNSARIGTYLSNLGFNADFAPVADIWTNKENTVIGNRAFATEAETAAEMVRESVRGFHKAGILTSLKHFPGHGDTVADTHMESAVSGKTWEEMKSCEMIPFKAGIKAGADMVMIAHIRTPNAGAGNLPATLSKTWITDRLRGTLGFDGVIITDAMGMNAISKHFESAEAALMAINAGCDIVLMPDDCIKVFDYLVSCVEEGTLAVERVDRSVRRILRMKLQPAFQPGRGD